MQQPMGENTNGTLPDISSTDIGPNKLNIPNKVVKINNMRGLQFYQKQLGGNNNQSGEIEEAGGGGSNTSHIKIFNEPGSTTSRFSVSNNMAMLRNRSTSPTIYKDQINSS